MPDQSSIKNLLLRSMDHADFCAINSHLSKVDLVRSQELIRPGETIAHCWFLEDGIASMVAMSAEGHETEAGIVGREGMVDVATILGSANSPIRCFIQIPGDGFRLPVAVLARRIEISPHLRALLNRYAYSCLLQIADTALANASYTVEERLARWLLMCADRLGHDDIVLTHEFLSTMLNVRRAGVTLALHSLETAGLVETRRGLIRLIDRPGLILFAHDSYTPLGAAGRGRGGVTR